MEADMSVIEVWYALVGGSWFRVLHAHPDGQFEVSSGWDDIRQVHTIRQVGRAEVAELCRGVDALPLIERPTTAAFDADLPF
jgi:hypothetical protein